MCGCALSVMLLNLVVVLPTPHDYSGTFQGGYTTKFTASRRVISVVILSNSHSNDKGCSDHEGLHQLQNSFVADEDLHGWNVLQLTTPLPSLRELPRNTSETSFAVVVWASTTSRRILKGARRTLYPSNGLERNCTYVAMSCCVLNGQLVSVGSWSLRVSHCKD